LTTLLIQIRATAGWHSRVNRLNTASKPSDRGSIEACDFKIQVRIPHSPHTLKKEFLEILSETGNSAANSRNRPRRRTISRRRKPV